METDAKTVEREVVLPTDMDEAWRLITDPDDLGAWLGDEVELHAVPGSAGRVLERDGTHRRLVVSEVEEGRRIAWTWWEDGTDPDTSASHVQITLVPGAGGTAVRVVERPVASAGPVASARASAAVEAWSHRLLVLEALLLAAGTVRV